MNKNILLIQFSNREAGNSTAICRYLTHYYQVHTITKYTIDSSNVPVCGDCDYECLKPGLVCPKLTESYRQLMDKICESDLVYFIIPNYCGFPCGNYFAFNERSVGYFNGNKALLEKYLSVKKRFIIISNSHSEVMKSAVQQQVSEEPEIFYLASSRYGKKSIAGDILDSQAAKTDLDAFLAMDSLL